MTEISEMMRRESRVLVILNRDLPVYARSVRKERWIPVDVNNVEKVAQGVVIDPEDTFREEKTMKKTAGGQPEHLPYHCQSTWHC